MAAAPEHDVVVVGAGVIGLACAWRAAQRGLSVLVLDRDAPGAGASGVAAGMLAPVTEAEFGEEALLALNLAGAELWPAFAAELSGATFTVVAAPVTRIAPVILAPQAGVLGVGERWLTLVCDHRILHAPPAVRFLELVAEGMAQARPSR